LNFYARTNLAEPVRPDFSAERVAGLDGEMAILTTSTGGGPLGRNGNSLKSGAFVNEFFMSGWTAGAHQPQGICDADFPVYRFNQRLITGPFSNRQHPCYWIGHRLYRGL
jgi:hypothetical protein